MKRNKLIVTLIFSLALCLSSCSKPEKNGDDIVTNENEISGEEKCLKILSENELIQEKLAEGYSLLSDGAIKINDKNCYLFSLGTNNDKQFVKETMLGVEIESQTIYEYDVLMDEWNLLNKEG